VSAAGWPLDPWTDALLAELRQGGYAPAAWARFLACSWRRARGTARREVRLVRSWRRLSLAIAAGSALPVAVAWRRHGAAAAGRMGGLLAAGLAWQQADAYVHLGMNRRWRDGVLEAALGPATWLSYARGTVAYWLLTATIAGLDLPGLAPAALAVGTLTDVLDGALARRGRRATKLGAYADGEADLALAMALTLAAVRRGTLPAAACWLPPARYAPPVGVAFGTAFASGRLPALEHTLLGRLCGVAQVGLLGSSMAPPRWQPPDNARRRLLVIATMLSVASGVAQVLRIARPGRRAVSPCQWYLS
jgi:phosphatidylglycerophosphate synthase